MSEETTRLRDGVRGWYREEARKVAADYATAGDLAAVDFEELIRRAQILFACEMAELCESEADAVLPAGSADRAQYERLAAAMRAQGATVPESIRKALGEGEDSGV